MNLRGNTGGNNAIAIDVLRYLMKKDFSDYECRVPVPHLCRLGGQRLDF
jgi:hypothetical protein